MKIKKLKKETVYKIFNKNKTNLSYFLLKSKFIDHLLVDVLWMQQRIVYRTEWYFEVLKNDMIVNVSRKELTKCKLRGLI